MQAYKRILLKLSGEMLQGDRANSIDPFFLQSLAARIKSVMALGVELAIVVGGGNLFRGETLTKTGMTQELGDQMGMLATVMNALALKDVLQRSGLEACIFSAMIIDGCVKAYVRDDVLAALSARSIVIFAGGTGQPFFTTDTTASLRAIQIEADILLKATKVSGIYDKDPQKYADAKLYERLSYEEVIQQKLSVMDLTAMCLCREHQLPIRVFDFYPEDNLLNVVKGQALGTLVIGS